jgi:hypothetical protein
MYRINKNYFDLVRSIVVEDITEDIKDVIINSHSGQIFFAGEKGIIYSQYIDKPKDQEACVSF